MKVTILHTNSKADKSTGEIKYDMTVLTDCNSFGVTRPATVQVRLSEPDYKIYDEMIGEDTEIEIVLPLPEYPLHLAK